MECHDIVLDERSRRLKYGGHQCLTTLEGYKIPMSIRRGLPYMDMNPPSDHELDTLPQVVLTSDANWDPTIADNEIEPDHVWYDTLDTDASPGTRAYRDTKFDHHGYYQQNVLSLSRSPLISQDTRDNVLKYVAMMDLLTRMM